MSFGNGIGDLKQALSTAVAVSGARTTRPESASPTSQGTSNTGTNVDQASLSTTSGLLAQSLAGSDVRTEKVEALRQAIADGSYQVPSTEVAGKVIQSLME